MPKTIVNLRGTSGAGKTSVVRNIMAQWPRKVLRYADGRSRRPLVYELATPASPLLVFGSYETDCGGGDTIRDYKTIIPALLREHQNYGDMLFEGMLISGTYGSIGATLAELEKAGACVVFAFLDTPLETCLARVRARREARGDLRPFNPENTVKKFGATLRARERIEEFGHRTATINHERPEADVLKLFSDQHEMCALEHPIRHPLIVPQGGLF